MQVAHLAASTHNKLRQALLHLQRWGLKKSYLARPWSDFAKDNPILRRKKGARRERRLNPGEEAALLAHATDWLHNLIVAALESCCRRGELLSLLWKDVSLARREITLRAENTKPGELRRLPISPRLAGVLDMLRLDPTGAPHSPTAHVFGNRVGEPVKDPKKAWGTCCRKAAIVDLHFHDLRHEAASRLLEAGWPLQAVQAMLGHKDAKTTSIYVNTTLSHLHDAMTRFGTQPLHTVTHEAETEPRPVCNDGAPTDSNALTH